MEKQRTDDETNLKRQARRRLIGAVALAIAIAVLLPMLLDSEPRLVEPQNIELRIPDKEKVGEFTPRMDMPPVPDTVPVVSAPVPVVPTVPADIGQKEVVARERVAEAAVKPVTRPPAGIHAEKNQSALHPGFVVQVGAFANADTAYQWQQKLSRQNIKSYTERVGDKTRVRAGPYATREDAENVYHRLQSQGLDPKVTPIY